MNKFKTCFGYKYNLAPFWYDCRLSKTGKKTFSVCGQQYACTSKKCTSEHCIRFQTSREAKINLVNYYLSPPDYFVVLRLENTSFPLDWLMTKHFLKCFKKQLKDDSKSINFEFEWEFKIEFDDNKNPHFHMVIKNKGNNGRQEIKSEFKRFLQEVWNSSISKFKRKYETDNKDNFEQIEKLNDISGSVYCEKIISISGTAIYLSKSQKYIWKYNSVPEEWNTTKCHIFSRSRGFLVKPKKELLKIYNHNREFFQEWKSKPLKDKLEDIIKPASNSREIKTTNPDAFHNDKTLGNENKESFNENRFKEKNLSCTTKKTFTTNWIRKTLAITAWGCVLVSYLVFAFYKTNFFPNKSNYQIDLIFDQNQRAKFMQKWFLDNGLEYYQNE